MAQIRVNNVYSYLQTNTPGILQRAIERFTFPVKNWEQAARFVRIPGYVTTSSLVSSCSGLCLLSWVVAWPVDQVSRTFARIRILRLRGTAVGAGDVRRNAIDGVAGKAPTRSSIRRASLAPGSCRK